MSGLARVGGCVSITQSWNGNETNQSKLRSEDQRNKAKPAKQTWRQPRWRIRNAPNIVVGVFAGHDAVPGVGLQLPSTEVVGQRLPWSRRLVLQKDLGSLGERVEAEVGVGRNSPLGRQKELCVISVSQKSSRESGGGGGVRRNIERNSPTQHGKSSGEGSEVVKQTDLTQLQPR